MTLYDWDIFYCSAASSRFDLKHFATMLELPHKCLHIIDKFFPRLSVTSETISNPKSNLQFSLSILQLSTPDCLCNFIKLVPFKKKNLNMSISFWTYKAGVKSLFSGDTQRIWYLFHVFYAESVHSGHYGHQIGDHLHVACASIEIQIIPHPFWSPEIAKFILRGRHWYGEMFFFPRYFNVWLVSPVWTPIRWSGERGLRGTRDRVAVVPSFDCISFLS